MFDIKFLGAIREEGSDEGKMLKMRMEREKPESGKVLVSVWLGWVPEKKNKNVLNCISSSAV